MQLFDPNNPNEKKKMIAAAVLGVAAIAVLGYVFFGGSSAKPATTIVTKPSPTPRITQGPTPDTGTDEQSLLQPIVYNPNVPGVSEADRNVFAYYEPTPRPTQLPYVPTPTPAPPPPLTAYSLNPSNVYSRTADFNLQVTGDKFTQGLRITIDGRDFPTRFVNAQQLAATVPAALIVNPGSHQVMVRNNGSSLYSTTLTLTVTLSPPPNFNYIGLLGKQHFNDTAVLQDKNSKELVNVQRGDVLGGRYRVSSISEKEVVVVDTTLKVRHTIAYTIDSASGTQYRPPVRPSDEDPPQ